MRIEKSLSAFLVISQLLDTIKFNNMKRIFVFIIVLLMGKSMFAQNVTAIERYNLGLIALSAHRYEEAAGCFLNAAENGLSEAQYNIGTLYFNGQGVPQNFEEAEKWLLRAAEQELEAAQCGLGKLYLMQKNIVVVFYG